MKPRDQNVDTAPNEEDIYSSNWTQIQ